MILPQCLTKSTMGDLVTNWSVSWYKMQSFQFSVLTNDHLLSDDSGED